MSKRKRLVWYSIVGIIILMQAYPTERPPVNADNPNDLLANVEVPKEIGLMLKTACYDCHSNETIYPWYANVAPVKWLVYRDTKVGREDLNFSDWNTMEILDKLAMLDEISTEVGNGNMPMKIYPLTHPKAKLSDEDRQAIVEWTESYAESLFE